MEKGLLMVVHSLIIALVIFVILFFLLKQSKNVAVDRSIFVGSLVLLYMILFGHGLPTKVNSNLF
jgi:hypothetical protein